MRNYFHKITSFEIDSERLYSEWHEVATKHNMFSRTETYESTKKFTLPFYYKLMINYPSSLNENVDPVWIQSGESNIGEGHDSYDINNIVKDFQGSHTEVVAKKCAEYLQSKYSNYYRLTTVKYAALAPKSHISTHTDGISVPRFFLSANVPTGCYMEVCGEQHPLDEQGAFFKMICSAPHSPINQSDGYRLMMVFDVAKINL